MLLIVDLYYLIWQSKSIHHHDKEVENLVHSQSTNQDPSEGAVY